VTIEAAGRGSTHDVVPSPYFIIRPSLIPERGLFLHPDAFRTPPVDGRYVGGIGLGGGAGLALIERFIQRMVLTNNQSGFLDLPRDFIYAGLMLRWSATGGFDITGGTTNGTLNDENPMTYIRRVIVEASGGAAIQLKNARGIHLYRGHHLLTGREAQATPLTSSSVASNTVVNAIIPVWFMLPGANIPPEIAVKSIVDPSEYGKLTLEVQAGDGTDFVNGGDRTNAVDGPVCDVYALQAVNVNINGDRPFRYIEQFLQRETTSAIASGRRFTNPLPTGRPYRYVLIRTTNEVTNARQPIDDTLGDIQLFISQTLVLRYQDYREYVERQRQAVRIVDAVNPAGLSALSDRTNPAIGYYMFDFMKDGRLEGVLDASRFPARGIPLDFLHDIDTANARQIDVVAGFLQPGGRR
jgi:hypothetical protein